MTDIFAAANIILTVAQSKKETTAEQTTWCAIDKIMLDVFEIKEKNLRIF